MGGQRRQGAYSAEWQMVHSLQYSGYNCIHSTHLGGLRPKASKLRHQSRHELGFDSLYPSRMRALTFPLRIPPNSVLSNRTILQFQRLATLNVTSSSNAAVCLVGHGVPPDDYLREKLEELIGFQHSHGSTPAQQARLRELDQEIRNWPRSENNDLYWGGLTRIAEEIRVKGRYPFVSVAFNEFCGPT